MNKSQKILQFVKDSGYEGRRFTDIQRFICELNGHDYDEFYVDYTLEGTYTSGPLKGQKYSFESPWGSTEVYECGDWLFSKHGDSPPVCRGKILSKKRGGRRMRGYYCVSLQTILAHCEKHRGRYFFHGPIPKTVHTHLARKVVALRHHNEYLKMKIRQQETKNVLGVPESYDMYLRPGPTRSKGNV